MPRYEFAEGGSNKFWEITLTGKSFTTTYGKIGAAGQTTVKNFGSDAEAKKEHDKLVAEKTKKGYALAAGTPAAGVKAAATPAPAPAAKAAPTPAAAPVASKPGARYFEFSEGTSNKFWEASLDGNALRVRYGKVGTAGQTTIKDFSTEAEAQKELDKLVAEKTKKGYAETTAGGAAPVHTAKTTARTDGQATADARNPELEKAIVANPTDRDAYAIFADWLQEQGDPRGELISLQLANRDKAARQLIDSNLDYFLGPLAEHQKTRDGLGNNSVSHLRTSAQEKEWQKTGEQAFLWRNGFIYRVRLSHDIYFEADWKGKTADVLDQVLRHPSGRYVVEFSFQGEAAFVVMRTSPHPITNLHLGGTRGDVAALRARIAPEAWDAAMASAVAVQRATGAFHVGVDLMFEPDLAHHRVLEGNAFGDLLPNLERDGLDVYGWQIRRLLGTVPA